MKPNNLSRGNLSVDKIDHHVMRLIEKLKSVSVSIAVLVFLDANFFSIKVVKT